jgi:AcrR family transcriptional regulator
MNPPAPVDLAQELLALSESASTKAERTRHRLLASAATLLCDLPFSHMRPVDLAEHAGVSRALLYHHFNDIADLVTQLMLAFEQRLDQDLPDTKPTPNRRDYPSLVRYLSWLLSMARRNRGIMRLIYIHADQVPGLEVIVDRLFQKTAHALGEAVIPPAGLAMNAKVRLASGYMIGGSFNDLIRRMLQPTQDPLLSPASSQDLYEVVQLAAILRYREIHGADPSAKDIRSAARSFDSSIFADQAKTAPAKTPPLRRSGAPQRLRRMVSKAASG